MTLESRCMSCDTKGELWGRGKWPGLDPALGYGMAAKSTVLQQLPLQLSWENEATSTCPHDCNTVPNKVILTVDINGSNVFVTMTHSGKLITTQASSQGLCTAGGSAQWVITADEDLITLPNDCCLFSNDTDLVVINNTNHISSSAVFPLEAFLKSPLTPRK